MLMQKTLCILSILYSASEAVVLRFPLSDADSEPARVKARSDPNFYQGQQEALKGNDANVSLGDAALFAYGLNITVGTPQQQIKVLLDIDFSTFFVQSSRCQTSLCLDSNGSTFNSSASSTYVAENRRLELVYANAWVEGEFAHDTVTVNGVDIEGVALIDADNIYPRTYVHWYTDYNGVLGLAPGYTNRRPHMPSIWESAVNNGVLDRNIFSIVPPTGLRYIDRSRTNGEFILGGFPSELGPESAVKLPMKFGPWSWATSVTNMTFGDTTAVFSSGTAAFSSVYPFIFVPYWFGRQIIRQVGKWETFGFFQSIPCVNRGLLPDWTFHIGGHSVTLNAFQYTFEITSTWQNNTVCALALETSDDNNTVGLGWSFWANYRGISFDQDEWTISLFE